MKKIAFLIRVGSVVACALSASPSIALTVDISAGPSGWGCTTCYGGPSIFGDAPGTVVTLTNQDEPGPLQFTLAAGTYSIRNAAPTGQYSAWRYDGGDDWAWNFVIGADLGNNQAQVLDVGWGGDRHYDSAADITSAMLPTYRFQTVLNASTTLANYYDTFTLARATTLDFFVIDGFLQDNVGGVALQIDRMTVSSVPLPASAPLFGAGLVALGIAGFAAKRKGKAAA